MKRKDLYNKYSKELLREVAYIEDNLPNIPLFEKWEMLRINCKAQGVPLGEKVERYALQDYQIYRMSI
jgi:hypothetical protein